MRAQNKVQRAVIAAIVMIVVLLAWSFGEVWLLIDTTLKGAVADTPMQAFYDGLAGIMLSILWKILLIIVLTIVVAGFVLVQKEKALRTQKATLDAITGNIPGGVICSETDDAFTIAYMSDSFLTMIGYTRDEVETSFDNKFIRMVYPLDRMKTVAEIHSYGENMYEVQYRIIHKSGVIIWILDKGQLVTDKNGKTTYYCVLVDISDVKRAEQELVKSRHESELSNKRYAILLEQTEDIIFDYDILSTRIMYSPNYRAKFGYPPISENFPESIIEREMIHPEDEVKFLTFYHDMQSSARDSKGEYRILTSTGHYVWCRVRARTIFNELGKPIKAVGRICDISGQREGAEWLVTKSQTDPLTGVLSIETTQNFIERTLLDDGERVHALFLLDINGFRAINEDTGRQHGDEILIRLSDLLQSLFRASDIVGRVGSDEFMILLKNCSLALAEKKAEEICTSIEKLSAADGYVFSVSAGVAMFPRDGEDFDMLCAGADCALGDAKKAKKNSFCFYKCK